MKVRRTDVAIVAAALIAAWWIYWPEAPLEGPPPGVEKKSIAGVSPEDLLETLERQQRQRGFSDLDSTALWAEGQDPDRGDTPMWQGTVGELKLMLRLHMEKPPDGFFAPDTVLTLNEKGQVQ